MVTIKSYTDINQSEKLAEILPLESADMYYSDVPVREWVDKTNISKGTHVVFKSQIFAIENLCNHKIGEDDVYAWSLSALLDVLKYPSLTQDVENKWSITDWTGAYPKSEYFFDSPVDACVEMIIKLHEQKII